MKRSTLRVLSLVFVLFLAAGCAQKDFRPAEVRFDERGVPLYEGKTSAVLENNELEIPGEAEEAPAEETPVEEAPAEEAPTDAE